MTANKDHFSDIPIRLSNAYQLGAKIVLVSPSLFLLWRGARSGSPW